MNRLRIVLVHPRIAANVGNVARTCLSLGAELHLVGPFGFIVDPKRLDRTSVGYWESLRPEVYADFRDFWARFPRCLKTQFVFAEKDGVHLYSDLSYNTDCVLIFGNEEEGVADEFWKVESLPMISSCRIPMREIRCLNLATSVGIVSYEVNRQWSGRNIECGAV